MASTTRGIIAAGHETTAQAGAEILQEGGNAFDAALAAMLVSFVSEASLTSMGGGGFMTAFTANGEQTLFDFFVQTPQKRKTLQEVDFRTSFIDFGTVKQLQYIGKGSVAVPGCPAGLFHIHKRLGSLPLEVIIQPAIALAREGVVITPYQAYSLKILESILLEKPECAAIYGKEGRSFQVGERMYMPDYADSLAALVKEGEALFYQGEMGQAFAEDNRLHGGSVSLEDLHSYRVIERAPLNYDFLGYQLLTNPPPSAGGSLICHGLGEAEKRLADVTPPKGTAYIHRLSEVIQQMEIYRKDTLPQRLDPLGNTTHISVLDTEGNAASLTTTLGGASGELIPGSGIQTNNMLGELDLFPGGLYQWPEGQRVSSMMSPSIILRDGKPHMVTGTGGSSRIRTAILQLLVNTVKYGMPLQEAVNYPRIHWEGNHLSIEPGLLADGEAFSMDGSTVTFWEELNMFFGGTHTVSIHPDGSLEGAADSRRSGVVKLV